MVQVGECLPSIHTPEFRSWHLTDQEAHTYNLALGRCKEEDEKLKTTHSYIRSSRLVRAT